MAVAMRHTTPQPTPEQGPEQAAQLALELPEVEVVPVADQPRQRHEDAALVWRLDDRTREVGRVGVENARNILRQAEHARKEREAVGRHFR